MTTFPSIYAFAFICLLCFGCTRVSQADDCCVVSIVNDSIHKEVHWYQVSDDEKQVYCAIQHLLQYDLVVDSAVQIALLNNPEIQAVFEEIGIAQADLVQAGLFQNPVFDGYVRFPDHSSLHLNTAFSITKSFLDILMIPLRKKIAEVMLEQAYLRVAKAAIDLSFAVQETFYHLQAEQAKQNILSSLLLAKESAYQLALQQREQGNVNDLDAQKRMNDYLESKIELTHSRVELVRLREKMNKLLGFSSNQCWSIAADLPELPIEEISLECLESAALCQRLDIHVARLEMERLARMLGVKQWWVYTDLGIGFSTEHEAEGFQETGVGFSGSIPIFNYGQAERARLHALYRQSQEKLKSLEIEVLTEIRSAREQLLINRNLVLAYQEELLPLQAQIVAQSQNFYHVMGLSVYTLLEVKGQELQMQINYRLSLRNYWLSRVQLDRALGASLDLVTCCATSEENR